MFIHKESQMPSVKCEPRSKKLSFSDMIQVESIICGICIKFFAQNM